MKEREKIIVSGLVTLLLLIWFGFVFHSDPSFAGSGWGLVFGIAGTLLIVRSVTLFGHQADQATEEGDHAARIDADDAGDSHLRRRNRAGSGGDSLGTQVREPPSASPSSR